MLPANRPQGPSYSKPIERAAHLREPVFVNGFARLGREEMAAAVGIEARRQAFGREHLQQCTKGRYRAFLLDQESRIDRAGGIIQRHDQIELRNSCKPRKSAAVLMQHHPFTWLARPFATMRAASRRAFHQPRRSSCVLVQV